jgi:hypothetical protein
MLFCIRQATLPWRGRGGEGRLGNSEVRGFAASSQEEGSWGRRHEAMYIRCPSFLEVILRPPVLSVVVGLATSWRWGKRLGGDGWRRWAVGGGWKVDGVV